MAYELLTETTAGGVSNSAPAVVQQDNRSAWQKWWDNLAEKVVGSKTRMTNDYMRGNYNAQQLLKGNPEPVNQSLADAANVSVPEVDSSLDVTGYDQAEWEYQKQRELLEEQREYNSAEAAKQREWEEHMSNTAYQRAVEDLETAGLNKWLAVTGGGNGASASTPSGASASSSAGDVSAPNPAIYKALLQFIASMTNSAIKAMKII